MKKKNKKEEIRHLFVCSWHLLFYYRAFLRRVTPSNFTVVVKKITRFWVVWVSEMWFVLSLVSAVLLGLVSSHAAVEGVEIAFRSDVDWVVLLLILHKHASLKKKHPLRQQLLKSPSLVTRSVVLERESIEICDFCIDWLICYWMTFFTIWIVDSYWFFVKNWWYDTCIILCSLFWLLDRWCLFEFDSWTSFHLIVFEAKSEMKFASFFYFILYYFKRAKLVSSYF